MLKELLRERLIAAADEIFVLFERTVASYEEQLCRAREESERHRRQLEAVCKTQVVIRIEDVEQVIGRQEVIPPHPHWESFSSEENQQCPRVKEENGDLPAPVVKVEKKELDISELQLTGVSMRSDEMSDNDDKQSKCSEKKKSQKWKKHITCSICGERYTKDRLIRHMTIHTGEKPFRCSLCNKTFSFRQSLVSHMRIHTGEKPFGCSTCGATFSRKDYMEAHMRIHTGEKPYRCSICGGSFPYRNSLAVHMKSHNNNRQHVLQRTPCNTMICEDTCASS